MSFDKVCYIGKSFLMFTSAKIAYFMLMKKNCRYYLADSVIFHIFAPHNKIPSIMNKKKNCRKYFKKLQILTRKLDIFKRLMAMILRSILFILGN